MAKEPGLGSFSPPATSWLNDSSSKVFFLKTVLGFIFSPVKWVRGSSHITTHIWWESRRRQHTGTLRGERSVCVVCGAIGTGVGPP